MRTLRSRATAVCLALRRSILLRRRLLAALLTAAAVLAGLQATRPAPPPSDWVLTASADLAAGTVLGAGDLRAVAFADGTAPAGATTAHEAVGRTLASPLRRGEPVTDARLVGPGLLVGLDRRDRVAVPVRIPDADAVALLRVGDRINLLATDPRGRGTDTVAVDVPVVALPPPGAAEAAGATGLGGRLVVVALSSGMSEIVADAAAQRFLSVTLATKMTD